MKSKLFTLLPLFVVVPSLFAAEPAATSPVPAPAIPPATARNPNQMMFREGGAGLPAYPVLAREETPPTRDARMKWFREARFGLFIHWGVYAVPAGQWKDRRGPEWIMNQAKIPVADYKALAQQFTAAKYDPQAWVALAKEAGMKYVVLTAKHHDGFALYDSAVSDWNSVKSSAAKRDLIQPLADATRAAGLKFGLYYSQSQDWINRGGGTGRDAPWDEAQKQGSFDEYIAKIAVPQVRELMVKYQPAYLFWDTEYSMTPERTRPFFDLMCEHPELISNNRLGGGYLGDTATPEQKIFTDPLGRSFEVNMTINGSWGYNARDTRWKSAQQLIRNLSDIASKGGNYLLNVSPTAEGVIPSEQIERLQAIGRWMRVNGEAIHATDAGPYAKMPDWGRVTQKFKPGGGTTLYVHVWNWPVNGKIVLSGVQLAALSGRMLANGAAVSSTVSREGLVVTLPGAPPDPDVSIAALDFSGPVRVIETTIRPADSTTSGTPLDPSGGIPPK